VGGVAAYSTETRSADHALPKVREQRAPEAVPKPSAAAAHAASRERASHDRYCERPRSASRSPTTATLHGRRGPVALDKNLTDCARKGRLEAETARRSAAIFLKKTRQPKITDVVWAASGPRYWGSNPCLPATYASSQQKLVAFQDRAESGVFSITLSGPT
jgi:hypothetical protein